MQAERIGHELKRWRHAQRGACGRAVTRDDLAAIAGCSKATIARLERGERPGSHALQVRLWAIMLSSAAELQLRPIAKAGRARHADPDARQLFLPLCAGA